MTVAEACRIATHESKEPFVECITDVDYGFVIDTALSVEEIPDTFPWIVNKNTGKIDVYITPEHFEELEKGKDISVPADYRLPD